MHDTVITDKLSHETTVKLGDPLTTVSGYADMILHNSGDSKQVKKHAEQIKTAATRIKNLVNELNAKFQHTDQMTTSTLRKPKTAGNKPSLLIIDDESIICEFLSDSLGDDFDVSTCCKPQEAQKTISGQSFDLILSDMRMPEVCGLDVLKMAKEHQPQTPILLTSGLSPSDKLITDALALGARGVIPKPFCDTFQLKERIMEHIPEHLHA